MFDLSDLGACVAAHGPVVRVVIAALAGSSPREVGTAMLVWKDGQSGTIGGGALEYLAVQNARMMLTKGQEDRLSRHALGPDLGQCCGGAITLLSEVYDGARVAALEGDLVVRVAPGGQGAMPLALRRMIAAARARGESPKAQMIDGWMIEPIYRAAHPLWIWGAGHVGRAIVGVMAPLPDFAITWVDTDAARFPADVPHNVTVLPAAAPEQAMQFAPHNAHHIILTYSHAIDLALCHAALGHGFRSAGVIGSATKWARFRGRLGALGHHDAQISRIDCPIGDPDMGKHPQAIAIGVASRLIRICAATLSTDTLTEKEQIA